MDSACGHPDDDGRSRWITAVSGHIRREIEAAEASVRGGGARAWLQSSIDDKISESIFLHKSLLLISTNNAAPHHQSSHPFSNSLPPMMSLWQAFLGGHWSSWSKRADNFDVFTNLDTPPKERIILTFLLT